MHCAEIVNDDIVSGIQRLAFTIFCTAGSKSRYASSTSSRATLGTQRPSKGVPAFCSLVTTAEIFICVPCETGYAAMCYEIIVTVLSASKTHGCDNLPFPSRRTTKQWLFLTITRGFLKAYHQELLQSYVIWIDFREFLHRKDGTIDACTGPRWINVLSYLT